MIPGLGRTVRLLQFAQVILNVAHLFIISIPILWWFNPEFWVSFTGTQLSVLGNGHIRNSPGSPGSEAHAEPPRCGFHQGKTLSYQPEKRWVHPWQKGIHDWKHAFHIFQQHFTMAILSLRAYIARGQRDHEDLKTTMDHTIPHHFQDTNSPKYWFWSCLISLYLRLLGKVLDASGASSPWWSSSRLTPGDAFRLDFGHLSLRHVAIGCVTFGNQEVLPHFKALKNGCTREKWQLHLSVFFTLFDEDFDIIS